MVAPRRRLQRPGRLAADPLNIRDRNGPLIGAPLEQGDDQIQPFAVVGNGIAVQPDSASTKSPLVETHHRIVQHADLGKVLRNDLDECVLREFGCGRIPKSPVAHLLGRSEEHTSELQSLMRISYAVFCLKKTKTK